MLQLQEKHPVMVDLPPLGPAGNTWRDNEQLIGSILGRLLLCSRGLSVIKYMAMSVETLEKTKPCSRKMKSSPKMIRSMSWIKKSMSWISKSSSTRN